MHHEEKYQSNVSYVFIITYIYCWSFENLLSLYHILALLTEQYKLIWTLQKRSRFSIAQPPLPSIQFPVSRVLLLPEQCYDKGKYMLKMYFRKTDFNVILF